MTDSGMRPLPEALTIHTDSGTGVFLAVAAEKYYLADSAFWETKNAMDYDGNRPLASQALHLEHLRNRRKATYHDLAKWVLVTEAERMAAMNQ